MQALESEVFRSVRKHQLCADGKGRYVDQLLARELAFEVLQDMQSWSDAWATAQQHKAYSVSTTAHETW